jgi:hypothetical protein
MAQTLDHSSNPACGWIACQRFRLCSSKGPTPFLHNPIQQSVERSNYAGVNSEFVQIEGPKL